MNELFILIVTTLRVVFGLLDIVCLYKLRKGETNFWRLHMSNKMTVFSDHVRNHFHKWVIKRADAFVHAAIAKAASVGEIRLVAELIRKEIVQVEAILNTIPGGNDYGKENCTRNVAATIESNAQRSSANC